MGTPPSCDPRQKAASVRAFVERLYADGGTSVQMIAGLFGHKTAERLIVNDMYGV